MPLGSLADWYTSEDNDYLLSDLQELIDGSRIDY